MSGIARIYWPIRHDSAKPNPVGARALDWMNVQLYSDDIGDFERFPSQDKQCLLSLLREVYSCVFFLACWPVSFWFRVKILFRTRLSKARRSAAPHRLLPEAASSAAPLSAVRSAQSSKRPGDLEIAARKGFRAVPFTPYSGPCATADGPVFFALLRAAAGKAAACIPRFQKNLNNRECFDV